MKQSELLMAETVNSDWYREFVTNDLREQNVVETNVFELPMVQRGVEEFTREGNRRVLEAIETARPRGLARLAEGLVDWLNG